MRPRLRSGFGAAVAVVGSLAAFGCGAAFDADVVGVTGPVRPVAGTGPLEFLWRTSLVPEHSGSYEPLETAVAALDPVRDRVYVGSSAGSLWAFTSEGRRLWRFETDGSIDGEPAIDSEKQELYFGNAEGWLVALHSDRGRVRWQKRIGDPIRNRPILTDDAVYVVTTTDVVVALSRENGEVLWRYRRDMPEGFSLSGHAGLIFSGSHIVTGFTDGSVVALNTGDGRVAWERDTTDDLEADVAANSARFKDVDTTPVLVGDSLFVASFAAGLYELSAANGSVRFRDSNRTGVAAIAVATQTSTLAAATSTGSLILSSSDEGLVCVDLETHRVLWKREVRRGAATAVEVVDGHVLVGENLGGLLAVTLASGTEVSRWESGNGFAAKPAVAGRLAFALSNGGSFFAFALPR